MRRLDRGAAIVFVDASDERSGCPIERDALMARFHACEDGKILSGAAAFAAMWRAIPLLRPFGLLAKNAVMLRSLEYLYVAFLRFRPLFQRMIKSNKSQ